MHADIKGALKKRKYWSWFEHRGNKMTNYQVEKVLKYGLKRGYTYTSELSDEEVDYVLADKVIASFTYNRVTEWVFSSDLDTAKTWYSKEFDCDLIDVKIENIAEPKWDTLYLLDVNETEPDPDEVEYNEDDYCSGFKIDKTFEEAVRNTSGTYLITTNDF